MNLFKQLESASESHRTLPRPPRRMLIYGIAGIGTSSLAAGLPSAVIVPADDSTAHIACPRFPIAKRFGDLMQALEELYIEPHDYRTVVLDPLDAIALLIHDQVCHQRETERPQEAPRADVHAITYWRRLNLLRSDIGMHVVLVGYARAEWPTFPAPGMKARVNPRYAPALGRRASALVQRWCDEVLFATHEDSSEGDCALEPRAAGAPSAGGSPQDRRIIHTIPSCTHAAKNRLNLPPRLAMDAAALLPYLRSNPTPQLHVN